MAGQQILLDKLQSIVKNILRHKIRLKNYDRPSKNMDMHQILLENYDQS
jgi:hypothetical protein